MFKRHYDYRYKLDKASKDELEQAQIELQHNNPTIAYVLIGDVKSSIITMLKHY